MTTPSVHEKARLTYIFVEAWKQRVITRVDDTENLERQVCTIPDKPIRQTTGENNASWCNKKTNVLNTIHGIAHAESYAIELFWDVIARFTHYQLPEHFYNEMVCIAGTLVSVLMCTFPSD